MISPEKNHTRPKGFGFELPGGRIFMKYGNDTVFETQPTKITLNCPDELKYKCVKSATQTSQSLEQWLLDAIEEKLRTSSEVA